MITQQVYTYLSIIDDKGCLITANATNTRILNDIYAWATGRHVVKL